MILVVDDEELVRRIACQGLQRLGYDVIDAHDGDSALKLLETDSRKVDLLFADVRMPGRLSGPALADIALRQRPGMKVLLTSGHARTEDFASVGSSYPVLPKPYRRAELAEAVASALSRP
ncbi:MAG: response regulator [Reyranellaceae bacterium]